jgi:serine/arginine repetitive matrix protein 2
MQALLEHSVQCYRPLPSDLRSRRVRTSSRPSPYPQSRVSKITISTDQTRPSNVEEVQKAFAGTPVLQEVKVNANVTSTVPSLEAIKPFSPLFLDVEPKRENAYGLAPLARPRVPSNARRTALGWSKRSSGKSSTDQKENVVGHGAVMTFVDFFYLLCGH